MNGLTVLQEEPSTILLKVSEASVYLEEDSRLQLRERGFRNKLFIHYQARPRHRKKRLEAVRNSVSPSPSRSPPKCVDTPDDLKPRSSNESPRKK
ncbi:Protein CBG27221 [Caenorhabditis briggsae]|uniref:Protein CBG27221 n=1 Tax=Caenorhabditis briggsae TaxID=6238 RepID=B6IFU4_CAEBR|nr:Protein CBG27221 [Caenorhabditis briggsae]CAR98760.1 Protein CBG27221 [Caenorhabditis briggsae]